MIDADGASLLPTNPNNQQAIMSNLLTDSEGEEADVEETQRSIISNIISQLGKGTDLSKISLPTFVLEPRSMTERLSDFLSHQYLLHE